MAAVAERVFTPEFKAAVTDIRLDSTGRNAAGQSEQLWQVSLDRTAFWPGAVGVLRATARSGATLEVRVERVEEDEGGEVWHFVRKPLIAETAVVGRAEGL